MGTGVLDTKSAESSKLDHSNSTQFPWLQGIPQNEDLNKFNEIAKDALIVMMERHSSDVNYDLAALKFFLAMIGNGFATSTNISDRSIEIQTNEEFSNIVAHLKSKGRVHLFGHIVTGMFNKLNIIIHEKSRGDLEIARVYLAKATIIVHSILYNLANILNEIFEIDGKKPLADQLEAGSERLRDYLHVFNMLVENKNNCAKKLSLEPKGEM